MTSPAVLLVQVRDHDGARRQEIRCILNACGMGRDELASWNLIDRPEITWGDVMAHRVLLIGGAGTHSATQEYDFTAPLEAVTLRWLDARRPLLGSCWGHHFLVRLLGGEVVTDPSRSEVGTFPIELTAAGRADPLLRGLPDRFAAQLGHRDRVESLPESLVELARSARCRFQTIRLRDQMVYGTQFHCELDEAGIRERLSMYPQYRADLAHQSTLGPSPWPPQLLRRFVVDALDQLNHTAEVG